MKKENSEKVSKFLSFILRHNPHSIGLEIDVNGWVSIAEIIEKSKKINLTRELIDEVVAKNDKQRFIIKNNKIRANQGHSIEVDLEFKAVAPPNILYHGTATHFLESIMKTGLSKQKRQHVHLSKNLEIALSVGKRHGKVVILKINSKRMFENGYEFYLSENRVWLTDFVPVEYLELD
jgi:putative RNA 2'-phosphotransferase